MRVPAMHGCPKCTFGSTVMRPCGTFAHLTTVSTTLPFFWMPRASFARQSGKTSIAGGPIFRCADFAFAVRGRRILQFVRLWAKAVACWADCQRDEQPTPCFLLCAPCFAPYALLMLLVDSGRCSCGDDIGRRGWGQWGSDRSVSLPLPSLCNFRV